MSIGPQKLPRTDGPHGINAAIAAPLRFSDRERRHSISYQPQYSANIFNGIVRQQRRSYHLFGPLPEDVEMHQPGRASDSNAPVDGARVAFGLNFHLACGESQGRLVRRVLIDEASAPPFKRFA